jgi:alternate signal-mediated exported protein
MTSTTPFTTNRNKRRTQGVIAIAAGALLLAGGSTFALWTASSSIDGGSITAGNADVVVSDASWQDVTAATPVAIDTLSDFRLVPGDVLQGTYKVDVAALGNNFHGDLAVAFKDASGALLGDTEGVTLSYQLFDKDGNPIGTDGTVAVISQDSTVVDPTAIVVDNSTTANAPEVTAVVTVTFDANTPEQIRTATQALLGGMTATLSQKTS